MSDDGHRSIEMHSPANGKLRGYCVRCGTAWPCEAEQQWQRIRDAAERAAQIDEDAAYLRQGAATRNFKAAGE